MPDAADLLVLQQKLRLADTRRKLSNLLVNDTEKIAPLDTAVLWLHSSRKVEAVSGLPEPVWNVPFTDWAETFCGKLFDPEQKNPVRLLYRDHPKEDQSRWDEFLAPHVIWVPLTTASGAIGGLLLSRPYLWDDEELGVLGYWGSAAGHAVDSLWNRVARKTFWWHKVGRRRIVAAAATFLFLIMWIPVDLAVNAAGEVVPKNPDVVRAPIAGIIGEVHVQPNEMVEAGQLVLSFDSTPIRAELDVVQQELAIANAEYHRANQAAVSDRRVASQLPMLKARVEQRDSQVKYYREILERSRIHAESASIAVIPDAQDLEGRPVQVGQKILTLAKPEQIELEFWLAVGDSIPLPPEAQVDLFLNVYPDQVHHARMRYVSYQAEVSPDGILGFKGRADFEEPAGLRVGWRGTAKVIGEPVTLFYFLFRRPLSVLRQWTGL